MNFTKSKPTPKKRKPSVLQDYKASYLDKRTKSYHHVIMTAFTAVFGLVGLTYVFGSKAATDTSGSGVNAQQSFLDQYGLMLLAISVLVAALVALILYKVSKSK